MNLTFNFYAKPSKPGMLPALLTNPSGDFPDLRAARDTAFTSAPAQAYSVVIESDDDTVEEEWVRDGTTWKPAKG